MSFGSPGGTRGANIVFNAETGKAKSEIGELGKVYERTTGQMSTDALRLAVAQEKLNRAIERSGPESTAAKNATVAYRREIDNVTSAANRESAALDRTQRELGQVTRGAIAGSGAFRSLTRSIAFASGGFLGGVGLVHGLRSALDASSALAEQVDAADRVFKSSAASVKDFADNALGLSRDQALAAANGIGTLLRPLGILPTEAARVSVQLTKLGVDLASLKDTPVPDALEAIRSGLVGESEPLRRYGILLSEARVAQVALTETGKESAKQLTNQEKVQARITIIMRDSALAQNNYADTIASTANQEREAQKNLRNTAILLGDTLQPAYRDLLGSVNDYLGNAENQRRIQEQVNDVIETGTEVAHGLADGIREIAGPVNTVVDALGGLENAVESALILGILLKARKAAAGFGLITAASARTRVAVVADAAAEQAAIARTGTAAQVAATQIAGARGRIARGAAGAAGLGLLVAPDSVPGAGSETFANLGTAGLLAAANPYLGAAYLGLQYGPELLQGGGPGITATGAGANGSPHNAGSPADARYQVAYQLGALGQPLPAKLSGERAAWNRGRFRGGGGGIESLRATPASQATISGTAKRVVTPVVPAPDPFRLSAGEQRDLAVQRAAGTAATSDDLAAARAIIEADRTKIAYLEERIRTGRGNKKKQIDLLKQLYAEEQSAQATIDSINSAAQAERDARARDRAAKARERAAKLKMPRYSSSFTVALFEEETKAAEALRDSFKKETEFRRPTFGQIAGVARGALAATLTGVPIELQLAEANAKTEEARERILRRELAALQRQYRIARENKLATKSLLEIARERNAVQGQLDQFEKARAQTGVDGARLRDSFLRDVQRIVGAYAPNAFPVGQARRGFARAQGGVTDTRLHELVHETRQTNAHLADIRSSTRFPTSKFALMDRDAAYG